MMLAGCAISTPFSGPGYSSRAGVAFQENAPVVIAISKAVMRQDGVKRSEFWHHVSTVRDSLDDQPGFIGHSIRRELFGTAAWTMTVWTDEASLDNFVASDVHQTAIREAFDALETTRFVRFVAIAGDIPIAWDRALVVLEDEGRAYD
ncbi:MAG: antibiotic biosynthesis monooxygenase [Pseudomonadota bacterium]